MKGAGAFQGQLLALPAGRRLQIRRSGGGGKKLSLLLKERSLDNKRRHLETSTEISLFPLPSGL